MTRIRRRASITEPAVAVTLRSLAASRTAWPRLKPILWSRRAAVTVILWVGWMAGFASWVFNSSWAAVAFGAIVGLTCAAMFIGRRVARLAVGPLTSWAAVCAASSAAFTGLAILLPTCPTVQGATGRCSAAELADASLFGLTTPAVPAVLAVLALAFRWAIVKLWRGYRKLFQFAFGPRKPKQPDGLRSGNPAKRAQAHAELEKPGRRRRRRK